MTTPEAPEVTAPQGPDASAPDDTTPIPNIPEGARQVLAAHAGLDPNHPMQQVSCARCDRKWSVPKPAIGEPPVPKGQLCPMCSSLAQATAPEREALAQASAHCKDAAAALRCAAQAVREEPTGFSFADVAEQIARRERISGLYEFLASVLDGSHDETIIKALVETAEKRQMVVPMIESSAPADDPLAMLFVAFCRLDYDEALERLIAGGPK